MVFLFCFLIKVIFFFSLQDHDVCSTIDQTSYFLLSLSPRKGLFTFLSTVCDIVCTSGCFFISLHGISLQICIIIMYTFSSINLLFTLGIVFLSISQNSQFKDNPHVIVAGQRGTRKKHLCPACDIQPPMPAAADNYW